MSEREAQFLRAFQPVNVLAESGNAPRRPGKPLKGLDRRLYSAAPRADNKLGAKGVQRCAAGYRVRFEDGGRSKDYGTFRKLDDAKARSRAVQAARISGDAQLLDGLRSKPTKAASGAKCVQLYRGRYRVRVRVDGVLRSFGSYATQGEAAARAGEVLRARASGDLEKIARNHLAG
jgi:hypothetical protein